MVQRNSDTETLVILPDGEVGELLIIGEHVAGGYYNKNAAQSAASLSSAFMSNPFLLLGKVDAFEGSDKHVKIMVKKSSNESGKEYIYVYSTAFFGISVVMK